MSQKGLAPILIVVLIAVLAVGGYLLYNQQTKLTSAPQPTTQSTPAPSVNPTESAEPVDISNWKTYTNSKYGYSVKYPNNAVYSESDYPGKDDKGGIVANIAWRYSINGDYIVQIYAYGETVNPGLGILFSMAPRQTILVANQKVDKIVSVDGEGNEGWVWIGPLKNNGNNFLFSYTALAEDPTKPVQKFDKTTFNQILSTFRFTP